MMPTRFLHLPRTYANYVFVKGSWNCEKRLYSTVSDQPDTDVGPTNMYVFTTMAEARRIIKESSITRMMVCIVPYRFLIVAL